MCLFLAADALIPQDFQNPPLPKHQQWAPELYLPCHYPSLTHGSEAQVKSNSVIEKKKKQKRFCQSESNINELAMMLATTTHGRNWYYEIGQRKSGYLAWHLRHTYLMP